MCRFGARDELFGWGPLVRVLEGGLFLDIGMDMAVTAIAETMGGMRWLYVNRVLHVSTVTR